MSGKTSTGKATASKAAQDKLPTREQELYDALRRVRSSGDDEYYQPGQIADFDGIEVNRSYVGHLLQKLLSKDLVETTENGDGYRAVLSDDACATCGAPAVDFDEEGNLVCEEHAVAADDAEHSAIAEIEEMESSVSSAADDTDDDAVAPPAAEPVALNVATCRIPIVDRMSDFYARRRVELVLNARQRATAARVFEALVRVRAKMANGKPVETQADAFRWLLDGFDAENPNKWPIERMNGAAKKRG